jgi:nitrogen fixation protein
MSNKTEAATKEANASAKPQINSLSIPGLTNLLKYKIHILIQVINLAEEMKIKHVRDLKVAVEEMIFKRKIWVMYLVVNDFYKDLIAKKLVKVDVATSVRFNAFVQEQVSAYMTGKTVPPAEIEGPILNIADDLLAGKEITLRTGDYIVLQTYMQKANPQSLRKA